MSKKENADSATSPWLLVLYRKREALNEEINRAILMIRWGSRLQALKEKRGMFIQEFCQKHGFDKSYVSNQIAGKRGCTKKYFDKFEAALKKERV